MMSQKATSTTNYNTDETTRTLSACMRCNRRKRKCDNGLPRCKLCAKARVPCEFYDHVRNTVMPRSYICQLEERLKFLQRQEALTDIGSVKIKDEQAFTELEPVLSTEARVENVVGQIGLVSVNDNENSEKLFLGYSSGFQLAQLLMDKIKVKSSIAGVASENKEDVPRASLSIQVQAADVLSSSSPAENLRKEPLSLPPLSSLSYLVSLYIQQSEVRHPIFIHTSLMELVADVYHNIKSDPHSLCIVNMVIAIGLQISSQTDIRSIPLADEYYQEALTYLREVSSYTKDLRTLQCLLLTVLYSLLNPAQVAIWHFCGIALRMCIDLGLHREDLLCHNETDPLMLDLKRRLWWSTYAIDRGLSLAIGRPFTIEEESITTEYPSVLEDVCICRTSHIDQINISKTNTNHWFALRRLQSEIVAKLYVSSDRKFSNEDPWFRDMHERLIKWSEDTPIAAPGPLNREWASHGFYNAIMLLYRPSPANPTPTAQSYMTSYQAACSNLVLYRSMLDKKSLAITWLVCHYHFMCGVTLLYTYYYSEDVRAHYPTSDLSKNIKLCSDFLEEITVRWPSASSMLEAFNLLASMTLKTFRHRSTVAAPSLNESPDNNILDESDLFADFGIQTSGMTEQEVLEQMFLNYPYPNNSEDLFMNDFLMDSSDLISL